MTTNLSAHSFGWHGAARRKRRARRDDGRVLSRSERDVPESSLDFDPKRIRDNIERGRLDDLKALEES